MFAGMQSGKKPKAWERIILFVSLIIYIFVPISLSLIVTGVSSSLR